MIVGLDVRKTFQGLHMSHGIFGTLKRPGSALCPTLLERRLRLPCVFDDRYSERITIVHPSHPFVNFLLSMRNSALYTRTRMSDTMKRCRQQIFTGFTYLCTWVYTKPQTRCTRRSVALTVFLRAKCLHKSVFFLFAVMEKKWTLLRFCLGY